MLLEIMLRDLDATIFSAKNGEEAINIALKEKPDLVISDVVMPKVNGFEVCRTIGNTKELFDTPIILLSALGDDYNKLTGFDERADDYMIKPFNVEELKSRSKKLILKYDGEFPDRYFYEIMNYLKIDPDYFKGKLSDKFRSPHLWRKIKKKWYLRHNSNFTGVDD